MTPQQQQQEWELIGLECTLWEAKRNEFKKEVATPVLTT